MHPECRAFSFKGGFFRTLIVFMSVFQVQTGNHFICLFFFLHCCFFVLFFLNLGLLQYWILIIYVTKTLLFSYCASIMNMCISNLSAQKKPRVKTVDVIMRSEIRSSRRHTFVNRTCALWVFFGTNILKEKNEGVFSFSSLFLMDVAVSGALRLI